MTRLFTFGCSFTRYLWPTWPDVIKYNFDHYENWGLAGSGNMLIHNSIVECNKRNKFTKDDTIIVMWTSVDRDDRYIKGVWTPLVQQTLNYNIDNKFLDAILDHKGCVIRDIALISSTKVYLENLGTNFYFLSMNNIITPLTKKLDYYADVYDLYKEDIKHIRPSMFDIVYKGAWDKQPSQKIMKRADYHPTPDEAVQYLEKVLPEIQIQEPVRKIMKKATQAVFEFFETCDTEQTDKEKINSVFLEHYNKGPKRL